MSIPWEYYLAGVDMPKLWAEYLEALGLGKEDTTIFLQIIPPHVMTGAVLRGYNPNTERYIFVFGSNLAGIHGAGAALQATKEWGAILGQGKGLQGDSYAIPTKNEQIKTLPLDQIQIYVEEFLAFAKNNPQLTFLITAIGCGLAGYKPNQITPFFKEAPNNCILPEEFGGIGKHYIKI
jgi:hypothetical protein